MKTILSVVFSIIIASSSGLGWVIEERIDYAKQLQKADFVGIVEITKIVETGRKKVLNKGSVQFRELRLELNVLSPLKGRGLSLTCCIFREPTEDELIADGVAENEVKRILLNLQTDEMLQLFPARVTKGAQLLVYLRVDGSEHFPVTGDLRSSRSLLRLAPSNLINALPREQEAPGAVIPHAGCCGGSVGQLTSLP
jgi:hypothetical protein